MFGLMTVARHEREMAEQRGRMDDMKASLTIERASLHAMVDHANKWQRMAEQTQADMADLMRRQAPPLPGPEESEMGTIADDEHTPSAIAKREKAVGARN